MGNSQSTNDEKDENGTGGSKLKPLWITLGVIFGAAVTTLLAPVIISALGFGSGGIVAGSIAASMMSASAPVPAGGVFQLLVRKIRVDCVAGSIPSWKDFHLEVVKIFPELKDIPYTVKDEDGIEVDEDRFPLVVVPKKRFIIYLEEKPDPSAERNLKPLWIGLGVVGGAGAAVVAAPLVIAGMGFGATGVVGGSTAAAMMSAAGNVAAGSMVATLQSIGAAGMGATCTGVVASAGAAVGGCATATGVYLTNLYGGKKTQPDKSSDDPHSNSEGKDEESTSDNANNNENSEKNKQNSDEKQENFEESSSKERKYGENMSDDAKSEGNSERRFIYLGDLKRSL